MWRNWIEVLRTGNLSHHREMDWVSKWLLITRACVFPMTLISVAIGALLAGSDGHFPVGTFVLVMVGASFAHAANNMVNDLFDVSEGVDTEGYPRANYAPHPLLDDMVSKGGLIFAIAVCNVIDLAIAIFLTAEQGWPIMFFAVMGLALSVFYVAPPLKLKHRGLGEPAIFLIWGPLITGGTYYAMVGATDAAGPWMIPPATWLATVPYGLAVTAVLFGKHLDKIELDSQKGIRTLPVILGARRTASTMQHLIWAYYLTIVVLAVLGVLPWWSLLALLSLKHASRFITTLSFPRPETPEQAFEQARQVIPPDLRKRFKPGGTNADYPLWPLWFVAWGVWWTRLAGGCFVLGLTISAIATWMGFQ